MNSIGSLNSVLCVFISFYLSWKVTTGDVLTDFTEPSDVAVIEETRKITLNKNGVMPENLDFRLNLVHGKKPVSLHLHKNLLGNEDKQVAVIRKNRHGRTVLIKEHIPKVKNIALYQDNVTYATFTVSCGENNTRQCNPILLGSLNIDGEEYEFHPMEERPSRRRRRRRRRHILEAGGGRKRWLYAAFKKTRKPCNKADSNLSNVKWNGLSFKQKQRTASYNTREVTDITAARKSVPTRVDSNALAFRPRQMYYLKLVVFIDYEIYMRWYNTSLAKTESGKMEDAKSNIRMYFAHVVNGIDIRYNNIEHSDFQIRVVVVEYIIADHPHAFDWMQEFIQPGPSNLQLVAVRGCLTRFVEWKDTIKDQLPPHDHVMLFTGLDLFEERTNDPTVTGYAHVRTVCTPKSASINEDHGGFGGITTATHELGHSLGANHDGIGNPCPGVEQYIMTATGGEITPSNKQNPWKFSDCSLQYFTDYIEELDIKGQNCMREEPTRAQEQEFNEHIASHPGQKFGPNEQCQQLLGQSSYYGWGGGLGQFEDICTNMACKNEKASESFNLYNAARGTSCGNKRWCINGMCVYDDRAPTKDEKCVHGDSQKTTENLSCSALTARLPSDCYKANFSDLCCESCKKIYTGKRGCEYGDKLPSCMIIKPQPFLCYDKKNEGICCASCSAYYTGIKGCEYGDKINGCDERLCHLQDHKKNCCLTCRPKNSALNISLPSKEQKQHSSQSSIATSFIADPVFKPLVILDRLMTTTTRPPPKPVTGIPVTSLQEKPKAQQSSAKTAEYCVDDVTCSVTQGHECYNQTQLDVCCLTCRKFETGIDTCGYGDKDDRCPMLVRRESDAMCKNYGHICCHSCEGMLNDSKVETSTSPASEARKGYLNNLASRFLAKQSPTTTVNPTARLDIRKPTDITRTPRKKEARIIRINFTERSNLTAPNTKQRTPAEARQHRIMIMRTLARILSRIRSVLRG